MCGWSRCVWPDRLDHLEILIKAISSLSKRAASQIESVHPKLPDLGSSAGRQSAHWPTVSRIRSDQDSFSKAKRKLLTSLGLFLTLLIAGTLGFYIVDRFDDVAGQRSLLDSLYFTLVVLTTVGMDGPVSEAERLFSIVLMLVGIFIAAATASHLVAFAIDGELNKHFGRRKLEKMLKRQEAHFIVVGFGRMGRALCEQLAQKKEAFVLIEQEPILVEEAERLDYLVVEGDATDEHTLERAGIQSATGLASCLPSDPANVFVVLTARGLRPQMEIVSRAENLASEAKLLKAGASRVICPPVVGAKRLSEMLIKPVVVDLITETSADAEDLDVCTFRVDALPGLMGKTLDEAQVTQATGMLVAAVERDGNKTFAPSADFALKQTDRLFVIGPEGGAERLLKAYGSF